MSGLGALWHAAGDLLRRHVKSKAVREAEKRRQQRRQEQAKRKAKRAGTVAGVTALGTFGYAVTVTPAAMAAVAAGGAAVAGLTLLHLWTSARAGRVRFSREELAALPAQAEDWLLDRRNLLPQAASGAVDTILTHLGDLPERLDRVEPNSTLAWEVRKLVGDHLPTLVNAWCALPSARRHGDTQAQIRLVSGLGRIAQQLDRFLDILSRDERATLETRDRFLESRYGEGPLSVW